MVERFFLLTNIMKEEEEDKRMKETYARISPVVKISARRANHNDQDDREE